MQNIADLTTSQLKRLIAVKEQIEALQGQIDSIADGAETPATSLAKGPKKRRMSAVARAHIAAGARARWVKVKRKTSTTKSGKKGDRRSSPEVRAKLAAAARARWRKAKAAGKKTL